MILCVTPNAAIDRTLIAPGFRLGEVSRAVRASVAAGGKGLNVARAIHRLGGDPLCAGFLAGHTGRLFAELAEREGLRGVWTWIEGETRACIVLVDPDRREATLVNEPGPDVSAQDWSRFEADVLREAASAECVCLSGSLPPGSPPEAFARLIRALCVEGKAVWVDTSGPALGAALAAGPIGIKVNNVEAGGFLGMSITDPPTGAQAAAELRRRGADTVVLTLGISGAVMVNQMGKWWAWPPALQTLSPIGSGDTFLGGLVLALTSGAPPAEALRQAVAAGAANALSVGGGHWELSNFKTVLAASVVAPISV